MCACTNEPSQTHMHTHMCLEIQEMRDVKFLLRHNIYCDICVFFLGHYVVHLLLFGVALPRTHFFYGTYILKIMGWV
jgi:hypothetical protein